MLLNSCIILSLSGSTVDHRKCCVLFVQNFGSECKGVSSSIHLERKTKPARHSRNMPLSMTYWALANLQCYVCAAKNKWTSFKFQCFKCQVRPCVVPCFRIYHTKVNFWIRLPAKYGKETISRSVCTLHLIIVMFVLHQQLFFFWKILFY